MHEASLYDQNSFVTLTFREEVFSISYTPFQQFMKRLRARFTCAKIRFYMCAEYGENSRGHYHACLFNFQFPDLQYLRTTPSKSKLFRSPILEELWPFGFSSVGAVTFESAAYVARYAMKKVGGSASNSIINPETGEMFFRTPPFTKMSLKPGIGGQWLDKFYNDVYPSGQVIVNGHEARAPRYYDTRAKKRNAAAYMSLCVRRRAEQDRYFSETLPGRLEARAAVKAAQLNKLKRNL